MGDCDAFQGIEIKSLNELECAFLLDVLAALAEGPATLPEATRRSARDSLDAVHTQIRRLEGHGLVKHESSIKSGHLVPRFFLSQAGEAVLLRSLRVQPPHT